MADSNVILECPAQGIDWRELSPDEAIRWVTDEQSFWNRMQALDTEIILGNVRQGSPRILQAYNTELTKVANLVKSGNMSGLNQYVEQAQGLNVILSEGSVGRQLVKFIETRDTRAAQALALLFSEHIVNPSQEIRDSYAIGKVLLRFNPYVATTADILSAGRALSKAEDTAVAMEEARGTGAKSLEETKTKLEAYLATKSHELQELHDLYETYLLLQGPSRHWKRVAQSSARYAVGAFAAFVGLLALPAITIYCNRSSLLTYIDHIMDITKGGLSLAPLVVFTVPVLAYGWLLKHVSRVFTQNLMVTSDAEHRRVMAITFLGLAKRKAVGMTEQDRALILNALFRPAPTSPQEEGPPMGLLDLVRK